MEAASKQKLLEALYSYEGRQKSHETFDGRKDATFMRLKDDHMRNVQLGVEARRGDNVQYQRCRHIEATAGNHVQPYKRLTGDWG